MYGIICIFWTFTTHELDGLAANVTAFQHGQKSSAVSTRVNPHGIIMPWQDVKDNEHEFHRCTMHIFSQWNYRDGQNHFVDTS